MRRNRQGFTLVELAIAIAFIAILLVAVTTVALGIGRTYQRGITLRDVNQAGREVMEVMQQDLAAANTKSMVVVQRPIGKDVETVRICTGTVSYLINLATALNKKDGQLIRTGSTSASLPARLVRVSDLGGVNCQLKDGTYPMVVQGLHAQDLLADGENSLAVHRIDVKGLFKLNAASEEEQAQLYELSLVLGTHRAGTVNTETSRCEAPQSSQSDFEYCAVYEFKTVVRAGYGEAS